MPTIREFYASQQQVMAHFGFYRDVIDGVWSQRSIEAKKEYEASRLFHPAFPNGGLPFEASGPFPKGVILDKGLLTVRGGVNAPDIMKKEDVHAAAASFVEAYRPHDLGRVNSFATPVAAEKTPEKKEKSQNALVALRQEKLKQMPYTEKDVVVKVEDLVST